MKTVSLSAVSLFSFQISHFKSFLMKERYFKANAEADEKDTSEQPHTGTGNRVQQFKSWLYFPSISALRANRDMKQVWWWKLTQEKCRSFVSNHQSNTVMLLCQFVCLSVCLSISCLVSTVFNISRSNYVWCQIPTTAGADYIFGENRVKVTPNVKTTLFTHICYGSSSNLSSYIG